MTDPLSDPNVSRTGAARDPPGDPYSTTFNGGCARTSLSASASM
jgi:hypothetical protein